MEGLHLFQRESRADVGIDREDKFRLATKDGVSEVIQSSGGAQGAVLAEVAADEQVRDEIRPRGAGRARNQLHMHVPTKQRTHHTGELATDLIEMFGNSRLDSLRKGAKTWSSYTPMSTTSVSPGTCESARS